MTIDSPLSFVNVLTLLPVLPGLGGGRGTFFPLIVTVAVFGPLVPNGWLLLLLLDVEEEDHPPLVEEEDDDEEVNV
eukprot:CAMPEP_0118706268 /NCGR_PEP_ID=MMETSP0800-20121206/20444_1 /TAXON_ID=210618 ORGANISM="Striatella unipunctata, Strain CCMP2910" /NCGR_SAMPLE_ID=MMETSP0800 /ASSEMBLY_ACC=CAM_ASM_000638 /LENGTH=75 /DNA_ID=CAMNT_0006608745 /DNA_START=141 /DNA_END=368 /DNA_ORIENTATION=+